MSGYYRHPFVLPISSRLECGLCHLVPRDPWQSVGCGHMFCKRCLEEGKFLNSDFCPVDLKETKYHKDRACGREVLALPVYCLNRSSGCAWKGRLVQLQVHTKQCRYQFQAPSAEYSLVECPICETIVAVDLLQTHMLSRCPLILRKENKNSNGTFSDHGLMCTYVGACKIYSLFGATPVNQHKLRDPTYGSWYIPVYDRNDQSVFEKEWEDKSFMENLDEKIVDVLKSIMSSHSELIVNILKSISEKFGLDKFIDLVTHPYVCPSPSEFKSSLSKNRHTLSVILKQCHSHININNWCDVSCLQQILQLSQSSSFHQQLNLSQEKRDISQFEKHLYHSASHLLYLLGFKSYLTQRTILSSDSESSYSSHSEDLTVPPTDNDPHMRPEPDATFIDGDSIASEDLESFA